MKQPYSEYMFAFLLYYDIIFLYNHAFIRKKAIFYKYIIQIAYLLIEILFYKRWIWRKAYYGKWENIS